MPAGKGFTDSSNSQMVPFLKWPGGKRWFVSKYFKYIPKNFDKYIEPFLGGGSVFFSLRPEKAIISDINQDLINLYEVMRDYPLDLKRLLLLHQNKHTKDYYYLVRSAIPSNKIECAARFLYLNRTCFNGMYRVNHLGQFNVPIGTKTIIAWDVDLFEKYSNILNGVTIKAVDFNEALNEASDNDFIFVDPPYTIAHNQNSFIKYNERLFTWDDQKRLVTALGLARNRGAIIFATNAHYKQLKDLYQDNGFYTYVIKRHSSISGKVEHRKNQEELLISTISNLEV